MTATDVTAPERGGQTGNGPSSPITITGLTNGDTYSVVVIALSNAGESASSAPSEPIVVGVPPLVSGIPPDGFVGVPYTFTFTLSGEPPPQLIVNLGTVPAGLTLSPDGTLSGTPIAPVVSTLDLFAENGVGIGETAITITIRPAPPTSESTTTTPTTVPAESTPDSSEQPTPTTTGLSAAITVAAPIEPDNRHGSSQVPTESTEQLAATGLGTGTLLVPATALLGVGIGLAVLGRKRRGNYDGGPKRDGK